MPVRLNLKPLDAFAEAIDRALNGSGRGPMLKAIMQWGAIFRGWARERFERFAKGGGDWDALKPSTIRGRRKGKSRKVTVTRGDETSALSLGGASILWDTGTLIGALEPTLDVSSGGFQEQIRGGLRVGYGGSARHESGGGTIAAIARYHQEGNTANNLPARPIIVEPSPTGTCMSKIVEVTERALGLEWRRATA